VRGIHQGMVMYAQGNNSRFPGLTGQNMLFPSDGFQVNDHTKDGAFPETRYRIMLDGNYFTGEYMISPSETKTEWTTGVVTTLNFSYAMLQISDGTGSVENNLLAPDANAGRRAEWSETLNTEAAIMGDRNTGAND